MRTWWLCVAAVAVIVAVAIAAAYQTHPAYDIAIGNRAQDDPLVMDFNTAERQPAAAGGRTYRWTRGESAIVFPGIGRTAETVTLTMAGGANPTPDIVLRANHGEIGRLRLAPDFADYTFTVPASYLPTGNLTLTIEATPFHAPGDSRALGVLVSRVRLQPASGIALPPARTALALWGAALLLMLALLVVGLTTWEATAATLVVVIGFAALLVRDRIFITEGAGAWLRVGAGTLLLAVALRCIMPPVMRRLGIIGGRWEARWLLAAAIGIFAVRLGGLYHPAMIVSDLTFHVHRFEDVVLRHIWYQEIPALYDQNRPVPYPPGSYLLFAPFALVVRNHADLLAIGTQLLDLSRLLIVGLVVWRVTRDRIAAACAALIAGIVPVAFLIFSWGNLTNAVGEWALTLLFALLALGAGQLRRPWVAAAFVAVVLLALLSHIGVAITTVALLLAALALWALASLRAGRPPWRDRDLLTAVALTGIAGALAFALFYRIPLTGAHAATSDPSPATAMAAAGGKYEIGGPRPDAAIGLDAHWTNNPLVAVIGQLWEEGYAFYRLWPLLLAPLGCWLLWRRQLAVGSEQSWEAGSRKPETRSQKPDPQHSALMPPRGHPRYSVLVCVVWLGVSLAFLLVGVLTGRYVRYAVTAIPAVAVGAGVALGYGWRWRWGKALTLLLLAISVVTTLVVWYGRITRAYHT